MLFPFPTSLLLLVIVQNSAVAEGNLIPHSNLQALEKIGQTITEPFPNSPNNIIGVGGLAFDPIQETWTTCSENIPGSKVDELFPDVSIPRLNHMKLNFSSGEITYLNDGPIAVTPSPGLKLEDLALMPTKYLSEESDELLGDRDLWLVSEANSKLVKTNTFFSKNFGAPDLNSFDTETFVNSRILRVDASTGAILEEATVPDFAQWDLHYDWESTFCTGDRPFQGLHALSIIPSSSSANDEDKQYKYLMFVGAQSSLFQDGDKSTEFSGSATRVLVYGLNPADSETDRLKPTSTYLRSLRYDTSQLTMKSYQKGSRHFNALLGLLALDDKRFLFAECEELSGNGSKGTLKIINRIFYVELDQNESVDACTSITKSCAINAPEKHLIWEREDVLQLDGIAFGPTLDDGRPTIALTLENDDKIGLHLELYALNEEKLAKGKVWDIADRKSTILRQRKIAVWISISLFVLIIVAQHFIVRCLNSKRSGHDPSSSTTVNKTSSSLLQKYSIGLAFMNSFLVGGVTFGYSGMVLILRKEGIFASSCACGSFCSKQKEELALVSTVGFAATIGCRLFVGLFMDHYGPKLTSVICCAICLSGFGILASKDVSDLDEYFMTAWTLLSIGGSGLHICGFHLTNVFKGDEKKKASAGISAAFGASSIIFPLMQIFNQFAGIGLQSMSMFYSVIVSIVLLNNLIVQPWDKLTPRKELLIKKNLFSKDFWRRDDGTLFYHRPKRNAKISLKQQMASFDFYGEACFFTISLLVLTHYLSTSTQIMYEKGDVSFTNNPNNLNDFMISRMAGWFNGLGFLWVPTVKYLMTAHEWPKCFTLITILNLIILGIVLLKNLEVQILGFTLLSFTRLLLFSTHHTYLLDKFGIENFGTLNGVAALMAAVVGFLSFPLQLFGLQVGYSIAFSLIGLGVVASIAFPIMLRRNNRAAEDSNDQKLENERKGGVVDDDQQNEISNDGAMHSGDHQTVVPPPQEQIQENGTKVDNDVEDQNPTSKQ